MILNVFWFIQRIANGGELPDPKKNAGDAITVSGSSYSAGIAEVTLPISFKMRNIEATVAATEKLKHVDYLAEAQSKRAKNESGYYQRFNLHDNKPTAHANSFLGSAAALLGLDESEQEIKAFSATPAGLLDSASAALTAPVATAASSAAANAAKWNAVVQKKQKSSDDVALERYKKVSMTV